jgi:hypothetical protein
MLQTLMQYQNMTVRVNFSVDARNELNRMEDGEDACRVVVCWRPRLLLIALADRFWNGGGQGCTVGGHG